MTCIRSTSKLLIIIKELQYRDDNIDDANEYVKINT